MRYSEDTKTLNTCQAEIPAVIGYRRPGDNLIAIRCPFCSTAGNPVIHHHGATLGPRVSHCDSSPRGQYDVTLILEIGRPKARPAPPIWDMYAVDEQDVRHHTRDRRTANVI